MVLVKFCPHFSCARKTLFNISPVQEKRKSKFKGIVEWCTTEECRGCTKQRKLGVVHLGVLEFGGQALNKEGSRREGTKCKGKAKN